MAGTPVGRVRDSSPTTSAEDLHKADDVDRDRLAHHHTLGWGPNQAAPGAETLSKIGTGGGGGEPGPQGPQGVPGPQGPVGPAGVAGIPANVTWDDFGTGIDPGTGGALGYIFNQGVASAMWTINHTLTFLPNVSVTDSSGNQVEGDVKYMSATQVVLTFSAAFSGTAYLS